MPAPTTVRGLPGMLSLPLYWLYTAWTATLRRDEYGFEHVRAQFEGRIPMVAAAWHDELFCLMLYRRELRVSAIVSNSKDGDWLAALLHRLGIGTARGSSRRGGITALREITECVNRGDSIVITVDGPRGPRHKVKPGAIHLAVRENIPLVPFRVFMDNSKKLGSWDRFQLPMPFSRIQMVWGTPYIPVLDDADPTSLETACADLEAQLNALTPTPMGAQQTDTPA